MTFAEAKDQVAREHTGGFGETFNDWAELEKYYWGFPALHNFREKAGLILEQHAASVREESVDLEFEREQAYQSGFVDAAKGNPSKYGGTACRDCGNTEYCNTHCSHRK